MSLLLAMTLTPYLYIGTGYKFNEPDGLEIRSKPTTIDFGSKYAAIVEVGFESDSGWKFGYSHHSQWTTGKPFNSDTEYYKDSIFVGKTFRWTK